MSDILRSKDFGPETTEEKDGSYCVFVRIASVNELVGIEAEKLVMADGESDSYDKDYVVAENDAGQINVDDEGEISSITPCAKGDVPGYTKEAEDAWRTSDEVINWQPPADEDAEEATEAEPTGD